MSAASVLRYGDNQPREGNIHTSIENSAAHRQIMRGDNDDEGEARLLSAAHVAALSLFFPRDGSRNCCRSRMRT